MDALKKAELAKRQGAEAGADGAQETDDVAAGLTLEPLPIVPAAPASEAAAGNEPALEPTMSLASHLEELDARFLEEAAAAARQVPPASIPVAKPEPPAPAPPPVAEILARPAPPAPIETARRPPPDAADDAQVKAAAHNLFAAKLPEKQEGRKGFAIAIGVLTVLSVTGIGGYFWWQLQPKSNMIAKPAMAPPALLPPSPPGAPTMVAVAPAPTPAGAAPTTAAPTGTTPASTTAPRTTSAAKDDDDAPVTRQQARQRRAAAQVAEAADEDSAIRVTRQPLKVDPAITRGFDAFNRGELALAQLEYERARKNDPRNTDVLHGMAAIAVRQGRFDTAEALYRQIIESDPQDSVAIAAMLNQRGQVDPGLTESRLKSLAAAQPELAAPHFSLGNLYARMGRWNDAQQAYFRAFNAEPENPDILYNLAISLEHMRQNKLAVQYYTQAVAAAASRPAGFDRAQVAARLKTLQP